MSEKICLTRDDVSKIFRLWMELYENEPESFIGTDTSPFEYGEVSADYFMHLHKTLEEGDVIIESGGEI
jgi:hypothetical protein